MTVELSISEFKTQIVTKGLDDARKLMDELALENPPVITDWRFVETNEPNVLPYGVGKLMVPRLQNGNGVWKRDENGKLIVQRWEEIDVLFSLPDSEVVEPNQPYPVAVYGHGLGDYVDSLSAIADQFASEGFAFAGINNVCHGTRAPIPGDPVTSLLCYFNFLNPLKFRDNIRDTLMNQVYFTRAIMELGELDNIPPGGDGIPDYDVENLYYVSISLGSIQGGTFSAIEENIDGWVLSSAGGKWTGIALEGPYMGAFVDIAKMIDDVVSTIHAEELVWLLGNLAQHILDSSDPANFLRHTLEEPFEGMEDRNPYLLQQSSSEDSMLGGLSGAYYCRAAAWPQAEPYAWDVGYVDHVDLPYQGSGLYQYDTDEHFGLWINEPIGVAIRKQALHFLNTHYQTGVGEIINPFE